MSIKTRILITAFSCIALTLLIACLGAIDINRYGVLTDRHERDYENAYLAERMSGLVDEAIADSRGIYASHSLPQARPYDSKLESTLEELQSLSKQWRTVGYPSDPSALAAIERDAGSFILFRKHLDDLSRMSLRAADAFGGAVDSHTSATPLEADLNHFDSHIQTQIGAEDRKLDRFKASGERQIMAFAVGGAGILLALVIWQLLVKVTHPLHRASKAIVELAEGHLEIALPEANGKDEISVLWRAIGLLKYRAVEARKTAKHALIEARRREAQAREVFLD